MNDMLMGVDEVADSFMQARYAQDGKLVVRFYIRAVKNDFKSNETGRPIFDEEEYVVIRAAGDKTSVVDTPVTIEHSQYRFPEKYAQFKKGLSQVTSGTPIDQWPQLSVGQVAELKGLGIQTVEQLADLPDNLAMNFMGANELRRKAAQFIKVAGDNAAVAKLDTELAKRDSIIAEMQVKLDQLLVPKESTKRRPLPTDVDGDGNTPMFMK